MDQVSETTLSRSHCAVGTNEAVFPAPRTPMPWRLAWVQTPVCPGSGGSTAPCCPIYGLWLPDAGRLCPVPQHSRVGIAFSYGVDYSPNLATQLRAGSPPPQVCDPGSQPKSRESPSEIGSFSIPIHDFSLVQIQSYASPASLCLPTEGDPSSLFILSLPVHNLWPVRLSPWIPGSNCPPGLSEFKVL